MVVTITALLALNKMYAQLFPKAIISLDQKDQGFWQRNRDGILAGAITTGIGASIAWLATAFMNNWDLVFKLMQHFSVPK